MARVTLSGVIDHFRAAWDEMLAPGTMFETTETKVRGIPMRVFAGAPPYPFHAQLREATSPIFHEILTGDRDPDEGLDAMAERRTSDPG
mgnify:CR=1 FL=1